MTDQDLEARARQNAAESEEALRQAAEARARAEASGEPTNPAQLQTSIAQRLKKKLEQNEFSVFTDENGNVVEPASQTEE
jgi:hypothetical protein